MGTPPGERFRLVSVNVGERAVTVVLSTDWTRTPSVQELEAMLDSGNCALGSVRF